MIQSKYDVIDANIYALPCDDFNDISIKPCAFDLNN